jgi:hypothetical protein
MISLDCCMEKTGGNLWGRGMYENNQALWLTANTQSMPDNMVELLQPWKQVPTIDP